MRKIAIVGNAIYEADLLEKTAEGWERWSVNNLYGGFPNVEWTRWYELHTIQRRMGRYLRRGFPNYPIRSEQTVYEYLKAIDALNIPVFMQKKWKVVKKSEVFPREAVEQAYGIYMGCSFAWMVAHALLEGVDELGFFGVALDGNEYYYQRPSVEYLLGIARERGITITIDETSTLLKANYVYAFGEDFDRIYLLHGGFTGDLCMEILTAIQQKLDRL